MINSVETVTAKAVLYYGRYVGCYYDPCPELPRLYAGYLRAFSREGNTNLLPDVASVYEWLGVSKQGVPPPVPQQTHLGEFIQEKISECVAAGEDDGRAILEAADLHLTLEDKYTVYGTVHYWWTEQDWKDQELIQAGEEK